MADALDKIRAGKEKAWAKLAAKRLGGREHDVVIERYTEGDRAAGTKGTWGAPLTLSPRPAVRFGNQYAMTDAGLVLIGDVKVEAISRSCTEDQLRGPQDTPNRWLIAGNTYQVVELSPEPFEYVAILRKRS